LSSSFFTYTIFWQTHFPVNCQQKGQQNDVIDFFANS